MKTSTIDPIRVDYLAAGDLGLAGRIGMTIAPGKKDPARDWDRDLAADLDRLRKVDRADVLVTLLVEDELRFLEIPDLLEAAAEDLTAHQEPLRGGGLRRESVVAEYATTAADGKTYQVEHFNLDVVISGDPWGYLALGDTSGHVVAREPGPSRDVPRAIAHLEKGLEVASEEQARAAILERLGELRGEPQ